MTRILLVPLALATLTACSSPNNGGSGRATGWPVLFVLAAVFLTIALSVALARWLVGQR